MKKKTASKKKAVKKSVVVTKKARKKKAVKVSVPVTPPMEGGQVHLEEAIKEETPAPLIGEKV